MKRMILTVTSLIDPIATLLLVFMNAFLARNAISFYPLVMPQSAGSPVSCVWLIQAMIGRWLPALVHFQMRKWKLLRQILSALGLVFYVPIFVLEWFSKALPECSTIHDYATPCLITPSYENLYWIKRFLISFSSLFFSLFSLWLHWQTPKRSIMTRPTKSQSQQRSSHPSPLRTSASLLPTSHPFVKVEGDETRPLLNAVSLPSLFEDVDDIEQRIRWEHVSEEDLSEMYATPPEYEEDVK